MFNTRSGRDESDKVVITPLSSYETSFGVYDGERVCDNQANNLDKIVIDNSPKAENPDHYNKGISPYDVAKTMYGADGLLKFVTINAIKYIQRYPHKYKGDPDKQLDDLIKAKKSLETAIELHKEIQGGSTIRHG